LDEIQWSSPGHAAHVGGLHDNSILHYFAFSPFFLQTSNNAILSSQAMYNPSLAVHVATRAAFEARLRSMQGLEYMVAQAPAETAPGTGTGVWIINKQTRRKRPGMEDEVTVHESYFIVGDNIYMAPALSDLLANRLLTVFEALDKFADTANSLPRFEPALGHTYLPPTKRKEITGAPGASQTARSETPSVRGATPMPEGQTPGASQGQPQSKTAASDTGSYADQRLLEESFALTLKYMDEYMDTNPITGQPGSFNLSSTGRKAQSSQSLLAAATATAAAASPVQSSTARAANAAKEDGKAEPPTRKASKNDKAKGAAVPGGKLKRKKSRTGRIGSMPTTPS
jgi:mediator of RNA polymerase II transcription subunit 6